MQMNDYQETIVKFDVNGDRRDLSAVDLDFLDKVLGLAGEAGEVADKVKKLIRDEKGQMSGASKEAIGRELGDLLWYLATCARYLGISMEEIALSNLTKLEDRLNRGKIAGSGDER